MIRKQMIAAVQPHLRDGEKLTAVAMAQRGSIAWFGFGPLGVVVGALLGRIMYYTIAFTDHRILLCFTGNWGVRRIRGVVAVLPVATKLRVPTGAWSNIDISTPDGTIALRVASRFGKDIIEGNASQANSTG